MDAGCCRNRVLSSSKRFNLSFDSKKANRLYRVLFVVGSHCVVSLFSLLLTLSFSSAAQVADDSVARLIHGSVVTVQNQSVASATVEVRDLHGIEVGRGLTNNAGHFEIGTAAGPGKYIILAAKDLQTSDERITLGQSDLDIRIALPAVPETIAPQPAGYIVSAIQLNTPERASNHLQSAHQRFSKMDLPGAEKEIARALEIDPMYARAYSMRSFVKLAANDLSGAVEDGVHAAEIDSHDPECYLALATAYNYRGEFEKAAEAAWKALSIRPDSWQARLEADKSLYGRHEYVQALSGLDQINKDFPDVHLLRADVLMQLGRSREAAEQFDLFLKQAPNDPRGQEVRRIVDAALQNPAGWDSGPR